MLVRDLSEIDLLASFVPLLPVGRATRLGPGDDAAVLGVAGDLVVTTDVLVEDRHFRTAWSTGEDVGWRAAMQNLADVAAMGAEPTGLVVALAMPGDTPAAWVTDLARGLAAACAPHGVGVIGGDLSGGPAICVAVTAFGELGGRPPVLRSGARVGDVVAVAGTLGRSAAGLALLTAHEHDGVVPPPGTDLLTRTYRRPDPPLTAGVEAAHAGATAMLDVSDGLLRDAGRIATASGVALDLDVGALAPDVELLAEAAESLGVDPLAWVLTGGEDHALLATFPPGALPASFRPVGRVGSGKGVTLDGEPWVGSFGWDHFGY